MSDFLTRLAERTLNLAHAVRPGTISMLAFEPDSPSFPKQGFHAAERTAEPGAKEAAPRNPDTRRSADGRLPFALHPPADHSHPGAPDQWDTYADHLSAPAHTGVPAKALGVKPDDTRSSGGRGLLESEPDSMFSDSEGRRAQRNVVPAIQENLRPDGTPPLGLAKTRDGGGWITPKSRPVEHPSGASDSGEDRNPEGSRDTLHPSIPAHRETRYERRDRDPEPHGASEPPEISLSHPPVSGVRETTPPYSAPPNRSSNPSQEQSEPVRPPGGAPDQPPVSGGSDFPQADTPIILGTSDREGLEDGLAGPGRDAHHDVFGFRRAREEDNVPASSGTVSISIGRVEVRGAPPVTASTRTSERDIPGKNQKPGLSLNDYLRRPGGRRR